MDVLLTMFRNLDMAQLNTLSEKLIKPYAIKEYAEGSYQVGAGSGVFLALLHSREVINQTDRDDQSKAREVEKLDKRILRIAKRFTEYDSHVYDDGHSASCWWMRQFKVGFKSEQASKDALIHAVNRWIALPDTPAADLHRVKSFLSALLEHVDRNMKHSSHPEFYPTFGEPIASVAERLSRVIHRYPSHKMVERIRATLSTV